MLEVPIIFIGAAFLAGLCLGKWIEAWNWRLKGNHYYMNHKESGGHLYYVKRETQP